MCDIENIDFCGSVTCVSHASFPEDNSFLLWSNGGVLHWYHQPSASEGSIRIFQYNYVHGIKAYPHFNLLLVYGNKSLAVLRYKCQHKGFEVLIVNDQLDDMILDAVILNDNKKEEEKKISLSLFIGYAHNFYDEVMISLQEDNGACQWKRHQRYQCPDICVLFALTISVNPLDHNDVIVASGNVFGKLTLWKKSDNCTDIDNKIHTGKILTCTHKHEGVVFRVVWKVDSINGQRGNQILTVSDDRTVRLWNVETAGNDEWKLSQAFVGWGHISRVWDAIFLDHIRSTGSIDSDIATCSEDGTIKLWNLSGQCTATFQGHSGSIWRITAIPYAETNEFGQKAIVVSGGNDGTVKFWDIDYHRHNSPKQELATMTNMIIPDWPIGNRTETETEPKSELVASQENDDENEIESPAKKKGKNKSNSSSNRRKNGVNMLRISPCGKYLILLMIDGKLWYVSINCASMSSSTNTIAGGFTFGEWKPIIDLGKVIVEADITFGSNAQGNALLYVAASFIDTTAACFSFSHRDILSESLLSTDSVTVTTWKPHAMKTVNIWFPKQFGCTDSNVGHFTIVTATLQGLGTVWTWTTEGSINRSFSFTTGRKEIASSCLIYQYKALKFLLVGDSRGGINSYLLPMDMPVDIGLVHHPTQFFPFIHKSDPVSAIVGCLNTSGNGFYAAGHDNFLSFFRMNHQTSDKTKCPYQWSFENTITTAPVQTPDQIIVTSNHDCSTHPVHDTNRSIYLTGYYGSSFLVYDVRRGMQIMKIEGGGWKRPHHSRLIFERPLPTSDELPSIMFACPAPVGKKETELQLFGYNAISGNFANSCDKLPRNRWPLQLGTPSFSNVSNCVVIVNVPGITSFTVVGGEDCMMRVFSQASEMYHCGSSSTVVSSSAKLLMETTLSKNSSLKSLATISCRDDPRKGVVVGAGGKLLFYIWTYDYSTSNPTKEAMSQLLDLSPLRKVYAGTVLTNASQDHRILFVKTLHIGQEQHEMTSHSDGIKRVMLFEHFLIVLADSRGFISVVDFLYHFSTANENQLDHQIQTSQHQVRILYQAEVSTCPLLGCGMSFVGDENKQRNRFVLVASGDTKGSLIYTLIPIKLETSGEIKRYQVARPYILKELTSQSMGTNSVGLQVIASKLHPNHYHVLASTGGDDQSLAVSYAYLGLCEQELEGSCYTLSFDTAPVFIQQGAGGAALKGSLIVDVNQSMDEREMDLKIVTVAYDQRISVWQAKNIITSLGGGLIATEVKTLQIDANQPVASSKAIATPFSRLFSDMENMISSVQCQWSIQWIDGTMTHVMEVSCLTIVPGEENKRKEAETNRKSYCMSISGQGFQSFTLRI